MNDFMDYALRAEGMSSENADVVYERVKDLLDQLAEELPDFPYVSWGGGWTPGESQINVESVQAYRETSVLLERLDAIQGAILSGSAPEVVVAKIRLVLGLPPS